MIDRLLIANRGEIARRVIRTAREMELSTVAVYLADDEASPYVRDADTAYQLVGDSYLDIEAILAAARATDADAVHPGYGFLSENAGFARAVIDAGLTWVGPSPDVIATMGDKLSAVALAEAADVPTLPRADNPDTALDVEFPVLIKAAAGGGGKGMKVVNGPADLVEALASARREALNAFGDDRVYLERYVPRSHHVEIQILGDEHGNLVHLGERECSIQRRHQKILEESPSPVLDDGLRARMTAAALRLGRKLQYTSAGTIEFLVDGGECPGPRQFWFLEANTRLQVEHPVTEAVTGLDLVAEQILIASGRPMSEAARTAKPSGHAIEVRLYAEDPSHSFLPQAGVISRWEPDPSPHLRWDSGIESGSAVSPRFDPLLVKAVAAGSDRDQATRRLVRGLTRTRLVGLTTNRDLLVEILGHERFIAGDTTTDFLDKCTLRRMIAPDPGLVHEAAIAATLWLHVAQRASAGVLGFMPAGWTNGRLPAQRASFRCGEEELTLTYAAGRDGRFAVDGREVRVARVAKDEIELVVNGQLRWYGLARTGNGLHVESGAGAIALTLVDQLPSVSDSVAAGDLYAPMPGAVVVVAVEVGQEVSAGQLLVVMEAMKMEHHITASSDGTVDEVLAKVGDQVPGGALLVRLLS